MTAIYLVRHGQASFAGDEYDELSAIGQEQSTLLGTALAARGLVPDLIVSGAMRRHRQTAAACLAAMQRPTQWQEESGWNEYDHHDMLGALDPRFRTQSGIAAQLGPGNPREAFQAIFAKAVARWTEGAHDADYKETWRAFSTRVLAALEALQGRLERGQTALVFTSGGVISIVARMLLRLPDEQAFRLNWSIANGSVTKLIVRRSGLILSTLNEHSHFEGRHSTRGEKLITYR